MTKSTATKVSSNYKNQAFVFLKEAAKLERLRCPMSAKAMRRRAAACFRMAAQINPQ